MNVDFEISIMAGWMTCVMDPHLRLKRLTPRRLSNPGPFDQLLPTKLHVLEISRVGYIYVRG